MHKIHFELMNNSCKRSRNQDCFLFSDVQNTFLYLKKHVARVSNCWIHLTAIHWNHNNRKQMGHLQQNYFNLPNELDRTIIFSYLLLTYILLRFLPLTIYLTYCIIEMQLRFKLVYWEIRILINAVWYACQCYYFAKCQS